MNQDQKDLGRAVDILDELNNTEGDVLQIDIILDALREERERTIQECADVAASHRMNDSKYMWKACSAEIVEEILKLKTPPQDGGK